MANKRPGPRTDPVEKLAVYLVADPEQVLPDRDLMEDVIAALDAGVGAVQLRAKRLTGYDAWALAVQLRKQCRYWDAIFLVNDRVDVDLAAQGDIVHVAVADLPLATARWLAWPGFLLGYSPLSNGQPADAWRQGEHYVGRGLIFSTPSKGDALALIELDGLAEQAAGLPGVAIGGITPENGQRRFGRAAKGVAVIGAVLGADDPGMAVSRLIEAVRGAKAERGTGGQAAGGGDDPR